MPREARRYGNFILAVISCVGLIGVFSSQGNAFLLVLAGLAAGLISRGVIRGTVSAAVGGVVVLVIVSLVTALKDGTGLYHLYTQVAFSDFLAAAMANFLNLYSVGFASIDKLIYILLIDAVALPVIGGFVGGAIRPGY